MVTTVQEDALMARADALTAQVAVLGSLLLEPKLIGEALTKVQEEDFLTPRCRAVFQAIRALFLAGEPADVVTVRDKLGQNGDITWDKFLLETMEVTPTASNIWVYTDLMKQQARLSHLADLGAQLQSAGNLEEARTYVDQINALFSQRQGVRRMNMEEMLVSFFERHTKEREYLSWGLPKIDESLYTEPGDFVVLGGYPSAGKTALAMTFAWKMAKDHRVGFYSLETSQYKLSDRLMSALVKLEMGKVKHSRLNEADWKQVVDLSPKITARKLELIPAGGMTVSDIQADALAGRYEIIFIDYLQLIPSSGKSRTEEVTRISLGLHQLAQRHGITVVALSQLSRPEQNKGNELAPTMRSLRDSGQIEQDADAIMLLYCEEPDKLDSRRVLRIAKNKEGEQGRVFLTFDGAVQTFRQSVLDAPAPRPRREPQYPQVQLHEVYDVDDPFEKRASEAAPCS